MYETEISAKSVTISEVPEEIHELFLSNTKSITHRSLISWAEHCTECTMPDCFSTCEFYTPRADLKCRRFEEGIVGIDLPDSGIINNLMKITFRKWGKLEGKGTTKLFSTKVATKKETWDRTISRVMDKFPLPYYMNVLGMRARSRLKEPRQHANDESSEISANYFALECYNPQKTSVTISLTIRPTDKNSRIQYQHFIDLAPGHNFECLPISDIVRLIDLKEEFLVQIQPQPDMPGLVLYFGVLDFVHSTIEQEGAKLTSGKIETVKEKKIKCVIWDLDNTLWSGTLIEDGSDNLVLNDTAVKLIKKFDEMGILNSIASKNNEKDALAVLEKFGIADYFLYPEISWEPKSLAITKIAKRLNIGIDTFAFIDDQPFERAEVSESHAELMCFDIPDLENLLKHPSFDVPISSESKNRRQLYKNQVEREETLVNTEGEYENFLISCQIVLTVLPLSGKTLDRVYELAQRTNQMNFSGNRYSRTTLTELMENADLDTYVLRCEDKFGDYGIIGFSIVRKSDATMQDLMFSCRIQSKSVDHAFLAHIIKKYRQINLMPFNVEYRQSPKNTPSSQIFSEMGFEEVAKIEDKSLLSFSKERALPTNEIVEVRES